MYHRTSDGLGHPSSLRGYGHAASFGEAGGLGEPARLVIHFTCSDADRTLVAAVRGVAVTTAQLQREVNGAVRRAVRWIRRAANALEQNPRSAAATTAFRAAFATTPGFVPSWRKPTDRWKDRGELVAMRLKAVARELATGTIRYFCWIRPGYCPECGEHRPGTHACSSFGQRSVICLGENFWRDAQAGNMAGMARTIVHEMLHIYFGRLIAHGPTHYGNAHCYAMFVVRFNGQPVPPFVRDACRAAPTP